MLRADRLKDVLQRLPVETPVVEVARDGLSLVATVTSASFAGLDEADRQEQVWAYLHRQPGEADLDLVEFVFTNAPGENLSEAG